MRICLFLGAVLALGNLVMTPNVLANLPQAHGIAASGQLARHPNSVLLSFLVEDCNGCLPEELQQKAIEQIISGLRSKTLVNPMEQVGSLMGSMSAFNTGAMLKQAYSPSNLLRGALGAGAAPPQGMQQHIQGMRDIMLDPWVRGLDAAESLREAGYVEEAASFYKGCLTSISSVTAGPFGDDWLVDRCIEGALGLGPQVAARLFQEIWDAPYPDLGIDFAMMADEGKEIEPVPLLQAIAARGLGRLAGSGGLTPDQREAAISALLQLSQQRKLDRIASEGVIQALAATGDSRVRPALEKMARRGKPKEIRPTAIRALAATFRDEWAIGKLRKELRKGGGLGGFVASVKSAAPWTTDSQPQSMSYAQTNRQEDPGYLAASVLLHIGDEYAFEWTNDQLQDRGPPDDAIDHRPDLVRDLVETGDERARMVLAERVAAGHPNEWLLAWMRLGLYELGDESQIDELRTLIEKSDWDFGGDSLGTWYRRLKPLLWEGAKVAAGLPADTRRIAQLVASFAFAERDRRLARSREQTLRSQQFRWQLADSLANIDRPQVIPIIRRLLASDDTSVRISAAHAAIGRTHPGAAELLIQALELDYGQEDGVSRNPEIRAALLRDLVTRFPDHPETQAALTDGEYLSDPSVAFMVYTAREAGEMGK